MKVLAGLGLRWRRPRPSPLGAHPFISSPPGRRLSFPAPAGSLFFQPIRLFQLVQGSAASGASAAYSGQSICGIGTRAIPRAGARVRVRARAGAPFSLTSRRRQGSEEGGSDEGHGRGKAGWSIRMDLLVKTECAMAERVGGPGPGSLRAVAGRVARVVIATVDGDGAYVASCAVD